MLTVCRECGEKHLKIWFKYMPTKKKHSPRRSVYIDETKRQWNGRQCPRCKYGQ